MYVAVKGGEKAIDAAHALQESRRRGDTDLPELSVAQIEQQLNLAVDRVMTEGGIADRELAALALKQASGDNVEAIFLLRAYRTTLAKLAVSEPLDTTGMRLERRISAIYKDIPGGQLLGPTYDYTHRLLDFTLLANGETPTLTTADSEQQPSPHVFSLLARQGLAKFEEDSGAQPDDITRTPPVYPCSRSSRLQQLMRGDEGYLLALAYSTQRGYGRNHPFAGEIRSGYIDIFIVPEELGFAVNVGELLMTECEMVNGFIDPPDEPPHFTRGYGLVFGMSERKAMAVSEAMIVKVSKLLGFSGFRNLRSALEDYFSQSEQVLPSELAFDEAPQDVVNKVFNITLRTIMEGQSIVNVDEIHRAARFFYQARQRDLYGAGGSNAICADVQHKFLRIGVRCQAYPDAHIMMMSASLLQEGDVVLVVTHSGRTSDVKAAVELAKKNGAKIICITHSYHSPIAKLADYIICSPAPETPLLGRNASARILQLTLLDAFFVSVAQLNIEQANINMQKTGAIVDFFSPGALK
ncbi:MurR/RpiR family transcriptional regulator [Escherichia coli]|nr:transcriptional repressor AlsR [Escherichia coli]QDM91592.1 MurR/RpiR family transcriptional regulator [Escherichia coli]RRO57107.1 MurR/RpiR family transcriptional regulator [Escherichia coli]